MNFVEQSCFSVQIVIDYLDIITISFDIVNLYFYSIPILFSVCLNVTAS